MSHDATRIYMGNTGSTSREIDNRKGTILAGLAVRLKSDDTISVAAADGNLLGVSAGKDLSGVGRTAVVRKGLRVPVRLASGATPAIGAQAYVSDTTGEFGETGSGFTAVNAVYVSAELIRVDEDGTEVAAGAAYIDMPGGL
jgi:hypothetical protein